MANRRRAETQRSSGHPKLNKPLLLQHNGNAFWEAMEVPFKQRYTVPKKPSGGELIPASLYSRLSVEDIDKQSNSPSPNRATYSTLEYRILGLDWHTRGIVNSCHMDGFISAFMRRTRQTKGALLREIKYEDDVAKGLLAIAKYTLEVKNKVDSERIKEMWLQAILDEEYEKPLDIRGLEVYSIFQHLLNHSGLNIEATCKCGTNFLWSPYLRVTIPDEVYYLQDLFMENGPESPDYQHLAKCGSCKERKTYKGLSMFSTSWCLVVKYDGEEEVGLHRIPSRITVRQDDQVKVFGLVYCSYQIPKPGFAIGHQVSLHKINWDWYLHDGMENPAFTKWTNPLAFDKIGADLTAVVYFLDPVHNSLRTGPPSPFVRAARPRDTDEGNPEAGAKRKTRSETQGPSKRGKK